MLRLILVILFFGMSLLTVFPAPVQFTWLIAIAVSAFCYAFIIAALLLAIWSFYFRKFRKVTLTLSIIAAVLFSTPIIRAAYAASKLDAQLQNSFGIQPGTMQGFHQEHPFSFGRMFSGTGATQIKPVVHTYASPGGFDLQLKFYPSVKPGIQPCLLVVHGGSWHSGSYDELPEIDNYFANAGYQVASINYRLAPRFKFPAPIEDVRSAISWLCSHSAELKIDTTNFVLMGRSAGGHIVLMSAYTLHNPNIKGVAGYYGPTDMLWSYENYANPLVLDSRKVERDFLGGSPDQIKETYIASSAMSFVTPKTVPTLLVHGKLDAHVWSVQAYRLAKLLNDARVKNMVLEIPWGTHGCEYNLSSPSGQLCVYATERFFNAVIHPLR